MRSILIMALAACWLAGCASSSSRGSRDRGRERLDVLASFTLALSKRDFLEAATYLAPADRAKLADAGGILPEYRERVRAIRRSTLMNNPLIEVRNGLITGIPDILPVLATGEAWSADSADGADAEADPPASGLADAQAGEPADTQGYAPPPELKHAAEAFFKAVSRRDWRKALSFVDAGERERFLDANGKVKAAAVRRLTEADTAGWEALGLKDGKLTGLVLILPAGGGTERF
jgi:hypothetical protein